MHRQLITIVIVMYLSFNLASSFAKNTSPQQRNLYLKKAFTLAESARKKGNHPFGALLVYNGKVILTAENNVVKSHDITAHAELLLIQQASKQFSSKILRKATLYTSTEPCAMCAGAIYWSGISHIVFGTSTATLNNIIGGSLDTTSQQIFSQGVRDIKIEGPLLEREANKIHKSFWTK